MPDRRIACEAPAQFRTGKPGFYPDQSVYAEFACAEFGLAFRDLDGGTGLLFSVASQRQNHSFRRRAMLMVSAEQRHRLNAGIGQIFCQPDPRRRRRCHAGRRIFLPARPASRASPRGHEREDALAYICKLGWNGLRQAADGIARRFRAGGSRRSLADSISRSRSRNITTRS